VELPQVRARESNQPLSQREELLQLSNEVGIVEDDRIKLIDNDDYLIPVDDSGLGEYFD
jgi:hypothetical protein